MFIFYFHYPFKQKHIHSMIHVFEYLNHIIIKPKILKVHFRIGYDNDYDASTNIIQGNSKMFPIESVIHIMKHTLIYDKKYFMFMILHEMFHALGLMKSIHTKWKSLIHLKTHTYIGKHANKKFKHDRKLKLYFEKDNPCSSDNHLSDVRDFFSATVYERISPVSLYLLKDYGYEIYEKIESVIFYPIST